ncbi:hypothetical protein GLOIN_2v1556255 [Rhizophagus irregularis DAOM 181602=DAOM 197198]|uniref:Uncharacterized protein n=1 Tax=Rhizophagus irregularis (strain DAOM 181602 / DAOM 197198 / MUCL 43194) TaxID=747089 RepID=A0A2P4QFL8_RHIID|nr:hypothetical protein GLOIN_2v1556255 [Rhizophagus irregularis DAOM 181602=DAOM 197198]POG76433.1 hypothetical protein GLOIN_2v1556255 [Rhizophagus irregularis DAOM 181602=DAOM 197198]GET59333.1 hypothetical protein GLOIN_2v1556255 [Rhizophagus irregularis DAOM 181602=DAOM 197198]|eukprot:XP_025183299.1 hypothetical protein GLOIN_2v1556255 [Rhizophagus irregularis DAOM 181602=DAOM 197198]
MPPKYLILVIIVHMFICIRDSGDSGESKISIFNSVVESKIKNCYVAYIHIDKKLITQSSNYHLFIYIYMH